MKPFGMLKIPMMLVGLGAALILTPACKAQEVSPDHFTDTGVQDVYEGASGKTVAPKAQLKQRATQPRTGQSNSHGSLQPVAKRTPVSGSQPGPQTVADRHKPLPSAPKKQ
jgi:hypothetical protein